MPEHGIPLSLSLYLSLQADKSAGEATIASLQSGIVDLQAIVSALKGHLQIAKAAGQGLMACAIAERRSLTSLQAKHDALQGGHAVLQGKHAVLQGGHGVMQAKLTALLGEHAVMQGDHAVMQAKLTALQGEHAVMQGEHAFLLGDLAALQGINAAAAMEAPNADDDMADSAQQTYSDATTAFDALDDMQGDNYYWMLLAGETHGVGAPFAVCVVRPTGWMGWLTPTGPCVSWQAPLPPPAPPPPRPPPLPLPTTATRGSRMMWWDFSRENGPRVILIARWRSYDVCGTVQRF